MINNLVFLIALIPLLMLPLIHANAGVEITLPTVSPTIHECIHTHIQIALRAAGVIGALAGISQVKTQVDPMIDNITAVVESCIK